MVIKTETILGSELNKREEEERIKLDTYYFQNRITKPTGSRIIHEGSAVYTITDMSQATQEEQEEFMEKRKFERNKRK